MRPLILAALMFAAAGAAQAQLYPPNPYDDPGRYNALQMQVEAAQRDALAAQQQAFAAQSRYETEVRMNDLATQRILGQQAIHQQPIAQGEKITHQLTADAERLAELTDRALARSNARVVAVKPALD